MPRAPMVIIPPERQSSRKRPNVNYDEATAYANLPIRSHAHSSTQVSTRHDVQHERLPAPPVDDYDSDENVVEPETEDEDDSQFRSRPKLPPSSVQKWKLAELMECIDDGLIELCPEYQRDVVWKPTAMSGLIDSLIEEYYIPPIIFNLEMNNNQVLRRVCVDGKQRLSSVHAFMQGKIPCHDKAGRPWYYCGAERVANKQRRRVWPDITKQEFRNKSFVCYEYNQLKRIEEEDLFARVQKGNPLTGAEKLQATSGDWQNLAKQFERDFSNVVNLSINARGKGFQHLLTAFVQILEVMHPSRADGTPATKIQMPSITSMCKNKPCDAASRSHLASVFSKFQDLVEMSPRTFADNNYANGKNFAPVEFVAVAVLISMYMDSRNDSMLIGDIAAMRRETRRVLADFRMDHITWKTMWEFIEGLESFRGAIDGTTTSRGPPRSLTVPAESRIGLIASFARPRSDSVDSVVGNPTPETLQPFPAAPQTFSQQRQAYHQQNQISTAAPARVADMAPTTSTPLQHASTFPTMRGPGPAGRNNQPHKRSESSVAAKVHELQAKRQKLSKERARLVSK